MALNQNVKTSTGATGILGVIYSTVQSVGRQ